MENRIGLLAGYVKVKTNERCFHRKKIVKHRLIIEKREQILYLDGIIKLCILYMHPFGVMSITANCVTGR